MPVSAVYRKSEIRSRVIADKKTPRKLDAVVSASPFAVIAPVVVYLTGIQREYARKLQGMILISNVRSAVSTRGMCLQVMKGLNLWERKITETLKVK